MCHAQAEPAERSALLDPSLRPEEFTIIKEELRRQQQVEIITVDKGYDAAAGDASDTLYRPKVGRCVHVGGEIKIT